ncbi:MAG: divalent metal cation transporter, partial [Alphaproteobacteria bacterium]|nr:divalent metal cation transporter [Alphaproteobacteria bacterium]
ILSLPRPFAIFPLVQFTTSKKLMGNFVLGPSPAIAAWTVSTLIVVLNLKLLYDFFSSFG